MNNGTLCSIPTAQLQLSDDVTISSWTTDEDNYLKIYTPTEKNEVGVSQRHQGIWSTSYYYFSNEGSNSTLDINDDNVVVEGIQITKIATILLW